MYTHDIRKYKYIRNSALMTEDWSRTKDALFLYFLFNSCIGCYFVIVFHVNFSEAHIKTTSGCKKNKI